MLVDSDGHTVKGGTDMSDDGQQPTEPVDEEAEDLEAADAEADDVVSGSPARKLGLAG